MTKRTIALSVLVLSVAPITAVAEDESTDANMPELRAIQAQVAELRGRPFKTDVSCERQSMQDFSALLDAGLDEVLPRERRKDMVDGLMRLIGLDEPADLAEELRNTATTRVSAYYDRKSKKLCYVITDLPEEELNATAAHELVHALQDQYHDLTATMDALLEGCVTLPRNEDALLAGRGLIEGEAIYVMTLWRAKATGMDLAADPDKETQTFKMPTPVLERYGIDGVVYMGGAYFTQQLRQHGGWEAVDKAFDELPQSTEQLLHPEKFTVAPDHPTRISMPDDLPGAGWTRIDAAIKGEWSWRLMLRRHGCFSFVADEASAGWDGDIYTAWRNDDDGRVIVALATTWDSREDATEFYEAYRSVLWSKYPGVNLPERAEPSQGSTVTEQYDTGDAKLGSGVIARRGREVFAVEGGDDELNGRMLQTLLELEIARVD